MSPELPINERVAAIEPQVYRLNGDVEDLLVFKDSMIKQIAELNSTVKTLSWKISLITGAVMVLVNQIAQWGLAKLLH